MRRLPHLMDHDLTHPNLHRIQASCHWCDLQIGIFFLSWWPIYLFHFLEAPLSQGAQVNGHEKKERGLHMPGSFSPDQYLLKYNTSVDLTFLGATCWRYPPANHLILARPLHLPSPRENRDVGIPSHAIPGQSISQHNFFFDS